MGAAPRLCPGRKHVRGCSRRGSPGSAAVCPSERLCLGLRHVQSCSKRTPPGSAAVGPSARLCLDWRTCEAAARESHLAVLQVAHQNGCQWGPAVCSAPAERGNLSILKWLRQHECQWDSHTTHRAAVYKHLELLEMGCQQQPPCPRWSYQECCDWSPSIQWLNLSPCVFLYLVQQRVFLPVRQVMRAQVVATEMTYAVLSLRAALLRRLPVKLC